MCLIGSDYKWLKLHRGWGKTRALGYIYTAVDVADYEWLASMTWYASVGRTGAIYAFNGSTQMQRLILQTVDHRLHSFKEHRLYSDHRNGHTLDNRRFNLRVLTYSQNRANQWPYQTI